MKNIKFKQITSTLVLSVFLSMQAVPLSYAATDTQAAISALEGTEYLEDNQTNDGSIKPVFGGETEWSVVALVAAGKNPKTIDNGSGESLENFLASDTPSNTAAAGDVERKILAVSATGNDVDNFGGYNYKEKLKTYYSDNQIGDPYLLNDDYFGIMAVKAIGDEDLKPMAQDSLNFIITNQNLDNGFGYATKDYFGNCCSGSSVDMTAAAIVALQTAQSLNLINSGLEDSKGRALIYMLGKQNADGGFDGFSAGVSDADSTTWALIALNVVGESYRDKALLARNWLISNQAADGSFGFGAYTTPHAVIALLDSSWLLDPKPLAIPKPSPPTKYPNAPKTSTSKNPSQKIAAAISSQPANYSASSTSLPISSDSQDEKIKNKEIAQVNSTSTPNPSNTAASNTSKESGPNWGLYGAGFLVLIGLGYFVVESLKARRTN